MPVIAIAPSPVQKDTLWVGTDDGRIQLTRDGGKTWTEVIYKNDDSIELTFMAKEVLFLNQNIGWIAWSPIYNKIAYQYLDTENNLSNISIANPDGSSWENIFQTRMNNLVLKWPSENKIILKNKTNTPNQSDLYILNVSSKKLSKILEKINGEWKIVYTSGVIKSSYEEEVEEEPEARETE